MTELPSIVMQSWGIDNILFTVKHDVVCDVEHFVLSRMDPMSLTSTCRLYQAFLVSRVTGFSPCRSLSYPSSTEI